MLVRGFVYESRRSAAGQIQNREFRPVYARRRSPYREARPVGRPCPSAMNLGKKREPPGSIRIEDPDTCSTVLRNPDGGRDAPPVSRGPHLAPVHGRRPSLTHRLARTVIPLQLRDWKIRLVNQNAIRGQREVSSECG